MALPKMHLVPDSSGYSSADGQESLMVALDGGRGRYRQDKIGATKMVNVAWTLNPAEYEYWRAFYRTATGKGALPFLCNLLSEDGKGTVEHTCYFIPGSVNMPQQQGLTYVQQAQLEVIPLATNTARDNAILAYDNAILAAGGKLTGFAP